MKELKVKKGKLIFKAGDVGDAIYLVKEGEVGIISAYGEKDEKLLVTLKTGKIFGEMALANNTVRSATAVAESDSVLFEYKLDSMLEFAKENPELALELIKNLSARLRALTADFMEACKTVTELASTPDGKVLLEKMKAEEAAKKEAEEKSASSDSKADESNKPKKKQSLFSRIIHFIDIYSDTATPDGYNPVQYNPFFYDGIGGGPFFY